MDEAGKNKLNTNELAYVYATTQWESRWYNFQEEWESSLADSEYDYFEGKYGSETELGRLLGNTQVRDGYNYRGRGFIHLTGRANYQRVGDRLSIDLIGNPDLAYTRPHIAVIAVVAMSEGLLTGKKLSDFNLGNAYDFYGARDIINGNPETFEDGSSVRSALQAVASEYAKILSEQCLVGGVSAGIICR